MMSFFLSINHIFRAGRVRGRQRRWSGPTGGKVGPGCARATRVAATEQAQIAANVDIERCRALPVGEGDEAAAMREGDGIAAGIAAHDGVDGQAGVLRQVEASVAANVEMAMAFWRKGHSRP